MKRNLAQQSLFRVDELASITVRDRILGLIYNFPC